MAKKDINPPTSGKKENSKTGGHHYSAQDITVLEGLEPVRKRPGMYIGTTGVEGLHHLIWEVFDNSRDEAMGGFADDIEVALLPGNRVRVVDNGRGIPVDTHKQTKVSALETIMTTLHAGGKFGGEGYKVSGGLHGVGVSVVNALSIYAKAEVRRDGGIFMQEYSQGKKKASVKQIGKSKDIGTVVTFEADPEIFKEIAYDWGKITSHLRQQAYLVKGMRVAVIDARFMKTKIDADKVFYLRELALDVPTMSFYFEGGLLSLVKFYNQREKPIHKNIFYVEKEADGVNVEISLQYVDDISSRILAFANNTYNPEGGMHITGFKTALTRTINNYARKNNLIKEKEDNFTGDDVLEGLTAVISIKMREIQFEGQTKSKLGSVEARGAVDAVFTEDFSAFLEEHPDDAKAIIGKVTLAFKARKAAKAAKDSVLRKGALEGMTLPGKLADCQSKKAEESEIFIVEGDSAGGCFSGDTKVALADGRNISFKELVKEYEGGKDNYCYTIKEDGNIGIALIENPRKTKINSEIIKIILDNDEEIICTPNHKFMQRDGSYKEAKELKITNSLMPLRRRISELNKYITIKGYELVYSTQEHKWIFTHLLSDKYNTENNIYKKDAWNTIHHKDFNKLNNNPDNLVRMEKQEHLMYHTQNLDKTLHSEETKEKSRIAHQKQEYKEKRKSAYNKTYLRKALEVLHGIYKKSGQIDIDLYNQLRKIKRDKSIIRYDTICQRFFDGDKRLLDEAVKNYNHRIKEIIPMKEKMNVYDLEVSGTHNFALAVGVFVHNSSKQGRDRRTQAILPLRGKILNVERARLDKMLASTEIKALVVALGAAIGDVFDISKIRYHKIIIATDADVDGAHIRTLLLTLFYRHFKLIIEAGYLYIAQPPLYKIKKGKEITYAYNENEKVKILGKDAESLEDATDSPSDGEEQNEATDETETKKIAKISIQRYKGLGEMNPEELWETTMDPEKRVLKQVTIEDAVEADRVFDTLMGTDVVSRKSFIQSNAKMANLDV